MPDAGWAPRSHHAATLLTSGKVLLAGGAMLQEAELWDPATNAVEVAKNSMAVPRFDLLATLLSNSPVLLWAGTDTRGKKTDRAEMFDPQTQLFEALSDPKLPRSPHTGRPELVASIPSNLQTTSL